MNVQVWWRIKSTMLRSQLFLTVLIAACSLLRVAISQSPDDCIESIDTNINNLLHSVPSGTLCVDCVIDDVRVTDFEFRVNNRELMAPNEIVVNDTLIILDTSIVFSDDLVPVRCSNNTVTRQIFVTLQVFNPPIITAGVISDGVLVNGVLTINETGLLNLDCNSANSDGIPPVVWVDDDGVEVSDERVFEIDNIQRNLSGRYICVTETPDPINSRNSGVVVIVQYAPDVFAVSIDLVDVPVGIGTLNISCTLDALPPITEVTWSLNTTLIDPNSDPRITITTTNTATNLIIVGVEANEGGTYECTATNLVGTNSAETNVRIQLPPDPPTDLQVIPGSETIESLDISWVNPMFTGFSDISEFRVEILGGTNVTNKTFTGNESTTQRLLDGLEPFTLYTIRLTVINMVGLEGTMSAETTGMTLSLCIDKVENLVAMALNSTAIMVSWEEPVIDSDTTDDVDMYRVTYAPINGGSTITITTEPNEISIILSDLMMGTVYMIIVIAVNSVGDGPESNVTVSTDIDPPSVPQDFIGISPDPFIISVSWSAPLTDGGRPLDRYILTLTPPDSAPLDLTFDIQSMILEHEYTNLQQNTTYQLSIVAINIDSDDGDRERISDPLTINITTLAVGDPQVPNITSVRDITDISATLCWMDRGGHPTNYALEVKERLMNWDNDSVLRLSGDSSFLSHKLPDLTPLTNYEARVLSINFNGPSDFSNITEFSTVGGITVNTDGGINGSIEVTSGDSITLICEIELTELSNDMTVDYEWSREDDIPLPDGATQNNGELTITNAQEGDSGVYICSANGVSGSLTLSVRDESDPAGVGTTVIIIIVVVVGVALLIFLAVAGVAFYCLCFRGDGKGGASPHKRTYSFRPKHWTEASGSHSTPREQQRREHGNSFHIPDDYTSHTSFNTTGRVKPSPSPPRSQERSHAGAEPTTSFQLSENSVL